MSPLLKIFEVVRGEKGILQKFLIVKEIGRMSTIESQEAPTSTESVAVAVHIRPLIEQELDQGCEECLEVTPGVPQVRLIVRTSSGCRTSWKVG